MSPKSILRSSSFLGRKSKQLSFELDEESSSPIERTLPPCMRKPKPQPVATEKPIAVVAEDVRAEEPVDERGLEPADDKINMSVTFDDKVDEVSMIQSFDYPAPTADDITIEKSLEITLANYLEFEKIRKERRQKEKADGTDDSEEATCGESVAEEVQKEDLQGEKLVDEANEREPPQPPGEIPPILSTDSLVAKLQEGEVHRIQHLKELNHTEIEKMKAQVDQIKLAMLKHKKSERIPINKTVEERMKKNLKVVEEALEAQKKIENEFTLNKNKYTQWQKPTHKIEKYPTIPVTAPPPVKYGLKLSDNYETASVTTQTTNKERDSSVLEEEGGDAYKKSGVWNKPTNKARAAAVEEEESSETSDERIETFTRRTGLRRAPYFSPNPLVEAWNGLLMLAEDAKALVLNLPPIRRADKTENSVVKAWNELLEMAEDFLADEDDASVETEQSGGMDNFTTYVIQRQKSKAVKVVAE